MPRALVGVQPVPSIPVQRIPSASAATSMPQLAYSEQALMIGLLSNEEVESMLQRHRVGRLACSANDRPYIVPIDYVYDGSAIYAYTSIGRKLSVMQEQPLVCFEIDEIEGPSSWRSVVIEGEFEELADEKSRSYARKLLTKNGDVPVLRAIVDGFGDHVILYRINISERSGRFERRDA